MKRHTHVTPGHDCLFAPCAFDPKCTPRNSHGICGTKWYFAVIADDELTALSLSVSTDIYPETVPQSHFSPQRRNRPLAERRQGSDLSTHLAFVTDEDALRLFDPATASKCDVLPKGWCASGYSSALDAEAFFLKHGDPAQFTQPEAFWIALGALLAEKSAAAKAIRADAHLQVCPGCNGRGVVEKAAVAALDADPRTAGSLHAYLYALGAKHGARVKPPGDAT